MLRMKETKMISYRVAHFKQKRTENLGWMKAVLIFISESQQNQDENEARITVVTHFVLQARTRFPPVSNYPHLL